MRAIFYLKTPMHLQELGHVDFPPEYTGELPEHLWTEPLAPDPKYPILVVHTRAGVPGTKPFRKTSVIGEEVQYVYEQPLAIAP